MENVKKLLVDSIFVGEYKPSVDIIVDDIEKFIPLYDEVGQNIMWALSEYRSFRLLNEEPLVDYETFKKHYLSEDTENFRVSLEKLFLEPINRSKCSKIIELMNKYKWTIYDLWRHHEENPETRVLKTVKKTNPYV